MGLYSKRSTHTVMVLGKVSLFVALSTIFASVGGNPASSAEGQISMPQCVRGLESIKFQVHPNTKCVEENGKICHQEKGKWGDTWCRTLDGKWGGPCIPCPKEEWSHWINNSVYAVIMKLNKMLKPVGDYIKKNCPKVSQVCPVMG